MSHAMEQVDLCGAHARDWAEVEDEGSRPLFEAVLDEVGVECGGTWLLGVDCGSGLACMRCARNVDRRQSASWPPNPAATTPERPFGVPRTESSRPAF